MVTGKRLCIVVAVVTCLALPAAAAAEPGDIAFDSCLANTPAEGCTDLPFDPIDFATGVAVSPDGKSVYVVSEGSDSIAHFFRDGATGALAYDGCLDNSGSNGCGDLPGAPLDAASGVAVSPDGKSVYVTSTLSHSITHFAREPVPPQPDQGGGPGPGGPGAPGPNADTVAPVISGLAVKRGRTVRFTLSEAAAVRVTVERARPGRRHRRLSPALRGAGAAGPNRVRFSGRLRRRLAPGIYRATVTATDAAGNRSSGSRVRFRVRPARP